MDLCVHMGGTFSAQSMSALIIGSIGRVQLAWISELYGRSHKMSMNRILNMFKQERSSNYLVFKNQIGIG